MSDSSDSSERATKGGFFARFRKQQPDADQLVPESRLPQRSGDSGQSEVEVKQDVIEAPGSSAEGQNPADDSITAAVHQDADPGQDSARFRDVPDNSDVSRFDRIKQVFRRGDPAESSESERSDSRGGEPATPGPAVNPTVSSPTGNERRFGRVKRALTRTGKGFGRVFLGKKQIDDELLEALETQLLTADLGIEATARIIETLTDKVRRKELSDVDALRKTLKGLLVAILEPCEKPMVIDGHKPFVLLTVGVNGVGKTTTIGKLARRYLNDNRSVVLAAGDTFRAAAVEQLQIWGERNNVPVVAQHTGADSASVIYDALASAKARQADLLIADTAGRLHTKSNLMEELGKIKRVLAKIDPAAPQEILLVLDAGTGQNALQQMQQFHDAVGITGIVLTKLDGTAKGGVIFALCQRFGVPVRYIGVGEGVDDLQPFKARDFVDALLAAGDEH